MAVTLRLLVGLFTTLSCLAGFSVGQNSSLKYEKQRGPGYDYTGFEQDQQTRADAVVEMFRIAWNGYQKYAFPNDELRPQNNSFTNSRNGWGCTAFDALDTAIIMEQTDIVNFILDYVPTVDFTKTVTPPGSVVSLFETNIRYLGGLISSYDLLNGPFSHLEVNTSNVEALLTQATSLADTLKFAFNTTSGVPVNWVYIENQTFSDRALNAAGVQTAGLAELGTLVLEWQRLSDLTGNPEYGALAQKAEDYWLSPSAETWPGLTGGTFSCDTGEIIDDFGGWTSGNDSAYEYLPKMYAYDPERYALYGERFTLAVDSTIANVLSSPSTRPDLVIPRTWGPGTQQQNYSEGLACFVGGSFILGSSVLNRPDWLPYGLDFAEWCANGYRYAASGLGPIIYSWDLDMLAEPVNQNQTDLYERAGWFIPDPAYYSGGQAPEAVESWYYAYQLTGDQYWRDVAWAYVLAQNATLRVGSGFGLINNVLDPTGGGSRSSQQTFFLAEVLKYQYLIQAEKKGEWDVLSGTPGGGENKNFFIYNTEAHPIRVATKNPV
ncbi:hypothetical protein N0V82_006662 [Gnomoniopsis sp. IMI 355080]|nr:hypothetical protein N0V82_006662 [Gnomoniopsis sp. IMI 355080]